MSKGWIQWHTLVTLALSGQKQIPEASVSSLLSDVQASERPRLKRHYGEYLWKDAELSLQILTTAHSHVLQISNRSPEGLGLGSGTFSYPPLGDSVLLALNPGPA